MCSIPVLFLPRELFLIHFDLVPFGLLHLLRGSLVCLKLLNYILELKGKFLWRPGRYQGLQMSLGPVLLKCILLQIYRKNVSLCGRHGQEPQYCVFKHTLMLWEVLLSLKHHYPLRPSMRPASQKRFRALPVTRLHT